MRSIVSDNPRLLVVTGPTASGKTRRAVSLARLLDGEIVSADSRQVYRLMDLGTGKDLDEYGAIPYHLIDVAEPGEVYNLYRFLKDARAVIDDIRGRGKLPVVCGGTGLYVESLVKGVYLPEVPENKTLRDELRGKSLKELTGMLSSMKTMHNVTDVDTVARAIRAIEIQTYYSEHPEEALMANAPAPESDAVIIGVDISREERRDRISSRLHARLDAGMVDEVRMLVAKGVSPDALISYGLEYKYLTQYVIGELSYDEMVSLLEIAIHQFAKRQMTWFRGMERRGFPINWIPFDISDDEFNNRAIDIIQNR